jgi:hypothetical protein
MLYTCSIELDPNGSQMRLEIFRDPKKLYIVVTDPETKVRKAMDLYLKQG